MRIFMWLLEMLCVNSYRYELDRLAEVDDNDVNFACVSLLDSVDRSDQLGVAVSGSLRNAAVTRVGQCVPTSR